jgi:hypothetical protein
VLCLKSFEMTYLRDQQTQNLQGEKRG